MKLHFHWHPVIKGAEVYAWIHSNPAINYLRIGSYADPNRLYIITNEKNMTYMRLSKYKLLLKKL